MGKMKSHDLQLPDWGPYSRRYAGIAHIPDASSGLRFDLAIIPGYYRRQMLIPSELWASGHHAWEAAPDLSYYSYRYEIEWKDQVYCDVSFSAASQQARLVRCEFINTTDQPQNLMLHLIASMNFPPVRPYTDEALRPLRVMLPKDSAWVGALDYDDLRFSTPRPTDRLTPDGLLRGEIRDHGLVDGSGIGTGFGGEAGDWVTYQFPLDTPLPDAAITLRYRLTANTAARVRLEGIIAGECTLAGEDVDAFGFSQTTIHIGIIASGMQTLKLIALTDAAFELDGFAITPANETANLRFEEHLWSPVPTIIPGQHPSSVLLRYADSEVVYGIIWRSDDFRIRQLYHHELDTFLRKTVPDNETQVFHGSDEGHYTDVFLFPLFLKGHARQTVHALVCSGTQAEVDAALAAYAAQTAEDDEALYASARRKAVHVECLPSGETYRFSQERMAATELMNVVYPIYTQRQYIRHSTPGKWWDCLYNWDSGFIGLALLELDLQSAVDNLNVYLTEPGNPHAAFIHHGTLIPMQIYLFHEMWNRTRDRALLARFYPSLRQMYLFLAGRSEGSTTRALKSNLVRTWEYFDDSGGWDDYPAQIYTWSQRRDRITCAAVTAHVIRGARSLLAAAEALGMDEDAALCREDIALFGEALQRHAWDAEAGYFSYVIHGDDNLPYEWLRHESGLNYNMGLDGVMPLFAGVCTPEQEDLFFARLRDPLRFWTPIGLSIVDQCAPYYRKDGYANGSVWMHQQWFIWKAALDLGQGDFAYQIAQTALDLWKRETESSYYCLEHFIVGTGRGAGWHQFSGLSSPVVNWFNAYHRLGRLTTGLDIWVEQQQFTPDSRRFEAQMRTVGAKRTTTIIVNMQPASEYRVTFDGEPVSYNQINPGSLQINLPVSTEIGKLEIITLP